MKVISVVGARPNFMKVAPIHRSFAEKAPQITHLIVHTGQHYDARMSDAFFQDLGLPEPDYFLGIGSGSHAEQTARVMIEFEKVCLSEKPDLVIVVGDVNSTVACSLTAKKLGIKVAHVESGLRSFDREMPEELNRIVTDAICDYAFVTEKSGKMNLIRENFPAENVFFVGNTMIDSLIHAESKADALNILDELGLTQGEYILVTLHRPTNVDDPVQLEMLLRIIRNAAEKKKIVIPVHPRTLKNIQSYDFAGLLKHQNILRLEPLGYIEFLALMKNAFLVLTDSGGVQEETTYLKVPCLTLRTSTERPSTIEIGSNKLIEPVESEITKALTIALDDKTPKPSDIPELWDGKAANRIVNIIKETILK